MDDLSLMPIGKVMELTGRGRSSLYNDIKSGLLVHPVAAGRHTARWPAGEVRRILQARIAGKSEDDIRELVNGLHAARLLASA